MSEWISVKDEIPPKGEFVEVVYKYTSKKSSGITSIERDYAARWINEKGECWEREGSSESDWSNEGFPITHWRYLLPDPKGNLPFLIVDKKGCFKIILKKSQRM